MLFAAAVAAFDTDSGCIGKADDIAEVFTGRRRTLVSEQLSGTEAKFDADFFRGANGSKANLRDTL